MNIYKNYFTTSGFNKDFNYTMNIASSLFSKRHFYIKNYKNHFLNHLKNEYNSLKNAFPEVTFIPEARIKSKTSYNDKVYNILNNSYFKDIYDIFANRYIIISVNGSREEKDIIPILYKMKNFLAYNSDDSKNIEERFKDYIAHPTLLSYQSLHIGRLHFLDHTTSYQTETQLRSYTMHYNANFGPLGHSNYYKKRIPGVTDVPELFDYVYDSNGNCIDIVEKTKNSAFSDFFNISYSSNVLSKKVLL